MRPKLPIPLNHKEEAGDFYWRRAAVVGVARYVPSETTDLFI